MQPSLFLISLLIVFSIATEDDTLISAAIIIRHGARTMNNPIFFNITDNTALTEGNGALTPVGKRMHYLAGKELYERYHNLFDAKYPLQSVYFLSSGLNRTIESMEALGIGMLEGTGLNLTEDQNNKVEPPIKVKGIEEIRKSLGEAALPNYQRTIAIHNRPDVKDYTYDPHSNCPGFKDSGKNYEEEINKLEDDFKGLYAKMKEDKNLPYNIRNLEWNTDYCYKLADNIQVTEGNGAELNFTFDEALKEELFSCSLGSSLRRFLVGELRPKMISNYLMHNVAELFGSVKNNTSSKRIGVYLMSDAHIMAIHRLFNWTLDKYVKYASALIFELHKKDDQYTVKVFYNDAEIPELNGTMKLEEFLDMISKKTFKDDDEFNAACFGKGSSESTHDNNLWKPWKKGEDGLEAELKEFGKPVRKGQIETKIQDQKDSPRRRIVKGVSRIEKRKKVDQKDTDAEVELRKGPKSAKRKKIYRFKRFPTEILTQKKIHLKSRILEDEDKALADYSLDPA